MDTTGVRRKSGLRWPLLRWRAGGALCTSADSLSSTVNCLARPLRKRFARRTVNGRQSLRTPSGRLRTAQSDRLRPMLSRPDWHAMPPSRMRCRILPPPPRRRPRRRQRRYRQTSGSRARAPTVRALVAIRRLRAVQLRAGFSIQVTGRPDDSYASGKSLHHTREQPALVALLRHSRFLIHLLRHLRQSSRPKFVLIAVKRPDAVRFAPARRHRHLTGRS